MGDRRNDDVARGRFGRRRNMAEAMRRSGGSHSGQPKAKYGGTDWLDPAAYNALSREEKLALAARRQQRRPRYPRIRRKERYSAPSAFVLLPIFAGAAFLSYTGWSLPNLRPQSAPVAASFGYCHVGGGTNCVVDGDTFWFQGEDIRIADIDAPETHHWNCPSEKVLGDKATERLHELVNSGPITLQAIDRDEDVYGRKLRLVYVNGQSVGQALIDEGLAHRYVRGKLPWC